MLYNNTYLVIIITLYVLKLNLELLISIMLKVYSCKYCKLSNTTKQHYLLHCDTKKHQNNVKINNGDIIYYTDDFKFKCINCTKMFKSNKGLWEHKKKCLGINVDEKSIINLINTSLNLIQKKIIFDYLKNN